MSAANIKSYLEKIKMLPVVQQKVSICEHQNKIDDIKKKKIRSATDRVLVSIVTVVYNAENELEETIHSILNQDYDFVEYIIIDGGSTDGTLDIIKKYDKHICFWLSQKDDGIYDAMNKGISLSNGEIIGILNAGDTYVDQAISRVIDCYKNNPESIITGNCKCYLENKPYWVVSTGNVEKLPMNMLPHSSIFIPRVIYQKYGLFDCKFLIAADYEYICRCYQEGVSFSFVNSILSIAETRGVSSNYYLTEIEYLRIRLRYRLTPPLKSVIHSLHSFFSITIHKILSGLSLWKYVESIRHGSER
jgi:glycosyltransferase involved in cell wall biosynthesis